MTGRTQSQRHELESEKWEQIRAAENMIETYDRMIIQIRDSGVLVLACCIRKIHVTESVIILLDSENLANL
jgi:hypothetical protein